MQWLPPARRTATSGKTRHGLCCGLQERGMLAHCNWLRSVQLSRAGVSPLGGHRRGRPPHVRQWLRQPGCRRACKPAVPVRLEQPRRWAVLCLLQLHVLQLQQQVGMSPPPLRVRGALHAFAAARPKATGASPPPPLPLLRAGFATTGSQHFVLSSKYSTVMQVGAEMRHAPLVGAISCIGRDLAGPGWAARICCADGAAGLAQAGQTASAPH